MKGARSIQLKITETVNEKSLKSVDAYPFIQYIVMYQRSVKVP